LNQAAAEGEKTADKRCYGTREESIGRRKSAYRICISPVSPASAGRSRDAANALSPSANAGAARSLPQERQRGASDVRVNPVNGQEAPAAQDLNGRAFERPIAETFGAS
jgi:hypothetical protein